MIHDVKISCETYMYFCTSKRKTNLYIKFLWFRGYFFPVHELFSLRFKRKASHLFSKIPLKINIYLYLPKPFSLTIHEGKCLKEFEEFVNNILLNCYKTIAICIVKYTFFFWDFFPVITFLSEVFTESFAFASKNFFYINYFL